MSRESKNLHFARRFARQFKSEDDANLLIETIRKEIPNVRKADCKFMLGVTVYKNLRKTMGLLSFYFLIQRNTAF